MTKEVFQLLQNGSDISPSTLDGLLKPLLFYGPEFDGVHWFAWIEEKAKFHKTFDLILIWKKVKESYMHDVDAAFIDLLPALYGAGVELAMIPLEPMLYIYTFQIDKPLVYLVHAYTDLEADEKLKRRMDDYINHSSLHTVEKYHLNDVVAINSHG